MAQGIRRERYSTQQRQPAAHQCRIDQQRVLALTGRTSTQRWGSLQMPCINRAEQQGLREKGRARVRGSRAEGEHRQHLKLMSKQSEGLIEGQRKTQRNDALHEDPCVDLVCRKVCKKKDM